MRPILEAHRAALGRAISSSPISPEREDPGNAEFGTGDIPKVVGGDGPEARGARRRALRRRSSRGPCRSPRCEAAEAVKLTENIFRAVNIALVNELKIVYDGDGHRRLGGDRGGQDQAVRLHAVLSRPGPRRALHPDRPVLPDLEGARVRHRHALHRAGRRDQHGDAAATSSTRPSQRSSERVGRGASRARGS